MVSLRVQVWRPARALVGKGAKQQRVKTENGQNSNSLKSGNPIGSMIMWLPGLLSLKTPPRFSGQIISVMPFLSGGQKTLSPTSAVGQLLSQCGASVPLFCLMVTSRTEAGYLSQLGALAASWSLPDFSRALRLSMALAELSTRKMVLPAPDVSRASGPLSTPEQRAILAQGKAGQVTPLDLCALQSAINTFDSQRQNQLSTLKQNADNARGSLVPVHYFLGMPADLKKEIPNPNHIFTLLTGFVGADVINLKGLFAL